MGCGRWGPVGSWQLFVLSIPSGTTPSRGPALGKHAADPALRGASGATKTGIARPAGNPTARRARPLREATICRTFVASFTVATGYY